MNGKLIIVIYYVVVALEQVVNESEFEVVVFGPFEQLFALFIAVCKGHLIWSLSQRFSGETGRVTEHKYFLMGLNDSLFGKVHIVVVHIWEILFNLVNLDKTWQNALVVDHLNQLVG